jgi:hypothetical protein
MATQWTAGTTSGQVLTAATLNTIGAVWVDYTPTLTQGVTVSKTVTQARYCQFQKTIIGQVLLSATSGGTGGTAVAIGLPIAVRTGNPLVGSGYIYDASTNVMYNLTFTGSGAGMSGYYQTGNQWGNSPNIALASGDQIAINFSYEIG